MHIILLLSLLVTTPTLTWEKFYSAINAQGVAFHEEMKALDGKRVRIRGYAVLRPQPPGGVYLTRFEHTDPSGVEEHDLPFDAVAVVWRKKLAVPPVPRRPTVEGVLRLGNRSFGDNEIVTVTLEDAIPVIAKPR